MFINVHKHYENLVHPQYFLNSRAFLFFIIISNQRKFLKHIDIFLENDIEDNIFCIFDNNEKVRKHDHE